MRGERIKKKHTTKTTITAKKWKKYTMSVERKRLWTTEKMKRKRIAKEREQELNTTRARAMQ